MSGRVLLATVVVAMLSIALAGTARAEFVTSSIWANDYWNYYKVDYPYRGYTNDGQYARIWGDDGSLAHVDYSFGSSLLADPNVYVKRIDVTIRAYAPTANGLTVQLIDNGTVRGPTLGAGWGWWVADATVAFYGNNGWTPAKLNTYRFRVRLTNQDEDEDVYVDSVCVKIYYGYGCVTTGAASNVTNSSATVDGSYSLWTRADHPVNQKGFDYWIHPANSGNTTPVYEPASGDSGEMIANLTGLLSNTQYGYKAGVRYGPDNAYEYGAWLYFVTLPETSTLAADNITAVGARLRGYVDPEGTQALNNKFYYSTTANTEEALKALTPVAAGGAEGNFTYALSDLTPETTYYYLACSTNSTGSVYGSVQSFTTPSGLPTVTTHPTDRSITYGANTSFTAASQGGTPLPTVQWQVSTDGVDWSNVVADAISSVSTNTVADTVTSTLILTKPPVSYSGNRYRALFINTWAPAGVATNAASLTVARADATIVVNGWSGLYDGAYHGATLGSATGVGGENLSGSVSIGSETYIDPPGGTVAWSFSHPNYNPQSGSVEITITPLTATLTVVTNPAAIGTTTGSGTHTIGTTVAISAPENVDIVPGASRYHFVNWTGATVADASSASTSLTMPQNDTTVTANYVIQYKVTFDASANVKAYGQGAIVTVNGDPKTAAQLPYTTDWIPSGTSITYAFTDVVDAYTYMQYVWASTSGLSQSLRGNTFAVTSSGTVTADYTAQYKVLFGAGSYSSDVVPFLLDNTTATIVTVNGVNKTAADLPFLTDWIDEGAPFSYSFADVLTGTSGAKYAWTRNRTRPPFSTTERELTTTLSASGSIYGIYLAFGLAASPNSQQYSDPATFTAEGSFIPGDPMPTTVHFYVGAQDMGSAPLSMSNGMLTGQLDAALLETVSGELAPGAKTVTAKWDNQNLAINPTAALTISKEDAALALASDNSAVNPTAVKVTEGDSGSFTFEVHITQAADGYPGDIALIDADDVSITLTPVGPGSPITRKGSTVLTDAAGTRIVTCDFNCFDVPVNTYEVTVTLTNAYFQADSLETVLTVYDPSLGFTTGGGWFYWPGTADPSTGYAGDKTNFGYSMQYGKNGSNLKGGLILIRHLQNGDIHRAKSNALTAGSLTLGTTDLPMGWASFGGKCNYTSILSDIAETTGNIPFQVYVEDRNEPGALADRFWIQVTGCADLCLAETAIANAVAINGGNIVVPHGAGKKK
ncbi:MAG: InlB B-repeat-containing protein [Armatimonadota bacterium]